MSRSEEAVRQAETEGLTLLKANNSSGYKGVGFNSKPNLTKPYQAQVQRGGKKVHLGYFVTVEEAALIIARASAANVAVAAAPPQLAASSRKRKIEPEEELEDAEEEQEDAEEEQEDAEEEDVEVVVLEAYELRQPAAMGAERTSTRTARKSSGRSWSTCGA